MAGRPQSRRHRSRSTRLAGLAEAWWWDRLEPAWQPHTREQNQAILEHVGLTGEFWRLG